MQFKVLYKVSISGKDPTFHKYAPQTADWEYGQTILLGNKMIDWISAPNLDKFNLKSILNFVQSLKIRTSGSEQ